MGELCNVSLSEYDGDCATFYREETRTARKRHTCHECGEVIEIGIKYRYVVGKWYDEIATYKFCQPCDETSREFFESNARDFGALWEGLRNAWDEGAHVQACVQRLITKAAKEHLLRQWRKWKGLE